MHPSIWSIFLFLEQVTRVLIRFAIPVLCAPWPTVSFSGDYDFAICAQVYVS